MKEEKANKFAHKLLVYLYKNLPDTDHGNAIKATLDKYPLTFENTLVRALMEVKK